MKMPFTTEQFFDLFRSYNEAVFPLQIVFYSLGILFAALTFIRKPWINITISAGLSLLWFWMALVYHLLFFSTINKAAYAFGIAFIIQALLLGWYGRYTQKIEFWNALEHIYNYRLGFGCICTGSVPHNWLRFGPQVPHGANIWPAVPYHHIYVWYAAIIESEMPGNFIGNSFSMVCNWSGCRHCNGSL